MSDAIRSQRMAIRAHLMEHGWIDRQTALALCDCDRLGARIWDLRHDTVDPMDIVTDVRVKTNRFGHQTRYAVYRMEAQDGVE